MCGLGRWTAEGLGRIKSRMTRKAQSGKKADEQGDDALMEIGLGRLGMLPPELRQEVYRHCLLRNEQDGVLPAIEISNRSAPFRMPEETKVSREMRKEASAAFWSSHNVVIVASDGWFQLSDTIILLPPTLVQMPAIVLQNLRNARIQIETQINCQNDRTHAAEVHLVLRGGKEFAMQVAYDDCQTNRACRKDLRQYMLRLARALVKWIKSNHTMPLVCIAGSEVPKAFALGCMVEWCLRVDELEETNHTTATSHQHQMTRPGDTTGDLRNSRSGSASQRSQRSRSKQ